MSRRSLLLAIPLALLASACDDHPTAPRAKPTAPRPALDIAGEPEGPPPPRAFGPDTYRIGRFTGQGTTEPGLTCGPTAVGRACSGFLPSSVDGTLLDASVLLPDAPGPFPLVTLVHGYGGSKSGSGDIALMLRDNGYAVLRYSTRGFGDSWGQVNLADINAEIADLRSIIGQVVDHLGAELNPDAVAVTGASYGGGHSWLALLQPTFTSPAGAAVRIRTVIPIVPWTDLVYSLLPNGRPRNSLDRLGGLKLSYVNGLFISGIRWDPDRPYPNYPEYLIGWTAWMNVIEPTRFDPVFRRISDGLAGYRSIWWQQAFWNGAAASRIPIFQVQGFTDDLFPLPEAKRMLLALKSIDPSYPIASYFGDLGHPRAANKTGEVDYVLGLLREWLAFYMKGEGAEPAHVVRAAITRPRAEQFDQANVMTAPTYAELMTGVVSREFTQPAVLVNPVSDPLRGFFWDPLVLEAARELRPLPPPPPSAIVDQSLAVYEVPVAELSGGGELLIAGQPSVYLRARTTASRVQLNVRLLELRADGSTELITRGTYTVDTGSRFRPIVATDLAIPTYGNLWRAASASRLRLEITNLDSPYITPSRVPSVTTISNVRLEVPFR
jgi:ABC-2 type transport system ATP-binding protein